MYRLGILASVWLTVNVVIGYVVAPVLFNLLTKQQAGDVMSVLLQGLYFFDLSIILLAIFGLMLTKRCVFKREIWLVLSGVMVALNQLWISPKMEWLKSHAFLNDLNGMSFIEWHGLSQGLFLVGIIAFGTWSYLLTRSKTDDAKTL